MAVAPPTGVEYSPVLAVGTRRRSPARQLLHNVRTSAAGAVLPRWLQVRVVSPHTFPHTFSCLCEEFLPSQSAKRRHAAAACCSRTGCLAWAFPPVAAPAQAHSDQLLIFASDASAMVRPHSAPESEVQNHLHALWLGSAGIVQSLRRSIGAGQERW